MRKVDPDTAFRRFDKELGQLCSLFTDASPLLKPLSGGGGYRTKLAELCFHKLYVAFETFVSDLFIGLVNRDPAAYQAWLQAEAVKQLSPSVPGWLLARTTFKTEKHVKVEDVRKLLDPNDYNITFRSAKDMQRWARRWLTPVNARGIIGLSVSDRDLINCAVSLRNFIAHESPSSLNTMNNQLRKVNKTGANPGLERKQNELKAVGTYLKASVNGSSRLEVIAGRFKDIANTMKSV
jgi:hypothetical protein